MPKVAIVILNWNGKTYLEKFLPSVTQYCPDYAEVFIADNGSVDGSADFLASNYPNLHFIDLKCNYGYTGGYNRALAQIDAQYYVLLNSDIEVKSNWIEPVIGLMDSDSTIAACQPKIMAYHQQGDFEYAGAAGGFIDHYGYPFCRGRIFDHLEKDLGQYDDNQEIFWATGACLFVRAADFKQVGMLDESFFAHMEEIDLCWRLKRMGKKIICCTHSKVYHVGGGTLPKNNPRKTFLNFRNNQLLLAKNLPAGKFYRMFMKRIVLDQLAMTKFLFSGNYKDSLAVYKAFFSVLSLMRRKRQQGKSIPYRPVSQVYNRSIVAEYFLRGKKKFSELDEKSFGVL